MLAGFWQELWAPFYESFIEKDRWLIYVDGLWRTIVIALGACLIGLILGSLIALVQIAPRNNRVTRVLYRIARLYVTVIRGTPVVLQLMICYFVLLSSIKTVGGGIPVACITFGLNSAAYMSENIRAGIEAIDRGQLEAGRTLGFSWARTMWYVVLPQGIKNALPTIFNEFIMLVKETSVAGYVGITDLAKVQSLVTTQTMEIFAPLLIIAVIYLVLVLGLQKIQKIIERRLRQGD